MQRNRNYGNGSDGHRRFQVCDRLRENTPKDSRCRTHLLKLEYMNQISQSTLIAAISNRPLIRRVYALTE
jgi:hypothetical protein